MDNSTIYVGLDTDDNAYHGCVLNQETAEYVQFKCRPTLKGLINQLKKIQKQFTNKKLKICYEASYIAFSLQRDLTEKGYDCDVVAPINLKKLRRKPIKTDRLDAIELVRHYSFGQLTIVNVPELETEQDRDFLRTRHKLVEQRNGLRRHIHGLLRRQGLSYKAEKTNVAYWTRSHYNWLNKMVEQASGSFKVNLKLLLRQLKETDQIILDYNHHIDELAQTDRYHKQVQSLTCYEGVKNLFALTIITEIGNIKRFNHPQKLVAWMGMDIREYSSGGKHNRFGITKHGNRYLRTAFVEANQRAYKCNRITAELKTRRKSIPPNLIGIADRCLERTSKKGNRLTATGKHSNVIKVACAREMVGFVWE
jgi:transposase